MQRRAFLTVSVGAAAAGALGLVGAGVPSWLGDAAAPAAALIVAPKRLLPGLPLTLQVSAAAPVGSGRLELWRGAERVAAVPFAASPGATLSLPTPTPPPGPSAGRYLVVGAWHAAGRDAERLVVGGYELLALRFST